LRFLAGAPLSGPLVGLAQVPTKRPLIAVLLGASQTTAKAIQSAFMRRLQELGYVEGRDYEIEYRYADGDLTRLPTLADEVVRLKPNVIVVGNSTAAVAAKQATSSIPIVAASSVEPIGLGLAASQARPEGNVTGILRYPRGEATRTRLRGGTRA